MPNNELGTPRRSQVVYNFGPGAIVDFSAGGDRGTPISVVVSGLDEWERNARPPGLSHPQVTFEPRLQKRLGVNGFRLPPVNPENTASSGKSHLIGVRFPTWLQCPRCNAVRPVTSWARKQPGDPARYCQNCESRSGGERVAVAPVRFVVACPAGHLDEFPWDVWVRHRKECPGSDLCLRQSEKAGLAGLILSCRKCGANRPMEGIFSHDALSRLGLSCRGRRPWLGGPPEACQRAGEIRVLQRGASNIYFPVTVSSLDIPPWSEHVHKRLGVYWNDLAGKDPEQRRMLVDLLDLEQKLGLATDEILKQVERGIALLNGSTSDDLRFEEYERFVDEEADPAANDGEFEIRPHAAPPEISLFFNRIVQATRLREVRAIQAFTRILPPAGTPSVESGTAAALQRKEHDWLPAIEVRGEGIFLQMNEDSLKEWESQPEVMDRAAIVHNAWVQDWRSRYQVDEPPPRTITPRFLLVHSLSHILIRQLSLECGYSSASLRERLYVDNGDSPMAGLLIYTATPDSDGTLGGLVRQGLPNRLADLLSAAVRAARWCSNDPLCIRDVATFSDSMNMAACHSCLMVSETSCEEFNRLLDRAMLVGTPENPQIGYFSSLLSS